MPEFTQNWSNSIEGSIRKCYPAGVPSDRMNVVEIGSFEGRGSLILERQLCLHPDSVLYCIDPWDDGYVKGKSETKDLDPLFKGQYQRFIENTKTLPKIKPLRGSSNDIVPTLSDDSIDFAYIDGDHSPEQVYKDGVMMFPKIRSGGYIVFDDYEWIHNNMRCGDGIDKFLKEYSDKIRLIFKAYQIAVKKV